MVGCCVQGEPEGLKEGEVVRKRVGLLLGFTDGKSEECDEGFVEGLSDGFEVRRNYISQE